MHLCRVCSSAVETESFGAVDNVLMPVGGRQLGASGAGPVEISAKSENR